MSFYPVDPISFSIEDRTYRKLKKSARKKQSVEELTKDDWEDTKYGPDYKGTFSFKVPSIAEQADISKLHAIRLSSRGSVNSFDIDRDMRQCEYVFALFEVCGKDKPEWFNKDQLWTDEDVAAVIEIGIAFQESMQTLKKKYKKGSLSSSSQNPES